MWQKTLTDPRIAVNPKQGKHKENHFQKHHNNTDNQLERENMKAVTKKWHKQGNGCE